MIALKADFSLQTCIEKNTALYLAASRNHVHVVKEVALHHPHLINLIDEITKLTPLMAAAQLGYISVVKLLLKRNAKIDIVDDNGWNAFQHAVRQDQFDVVIFLAQNYPYLVNHPDKFGRTALIRAAEVGMIKMIHTLLAYHADINHTDVDGDTALYVAAMNGHRAVFQELLKLKANPLLASTYSRDQLMKTTKERHSIEQITLFINRKLTLGCEKITVTPYDIAWIMGHDLETPLLQSIYLGKWNAIDKMPINDYYNKKELYEKDFKGKTLLHHAIEKKNHVLLLKIIMNINCDTTVLTSPDSNNMMPLDYFIYNQDNTLCKQLAKNPFFKEAMIKLLDKHIQFCDEIIEAQKTMKSRHPFTANLCNFIPGIEINAATKIKNVMLGEISDPLLHDELVSLNKGRLEKLSRC